MNISSAIKFALVAAVTGVLVGLGILAAGTAEGYGLFPVIAALAGFLTSFLCWKLIIDRRKHYTTSSAILTGALSGVISHPVCWYFFIIQANIENLSGYYKSSMGDDPVGLLEGLQTALAFSFFSLLITGWLTVGVAVLAAIMLVRKNNTG